LLKAKKLNQMACSVLVFYKKHKAMKNPFKREDNSNILIAGLALGAVFAGAITWLYIKRKQDIDAQAAELKEHAQDYLKKKGKQAKKLKTDVAELGEIIHHE
jgi:cbb3-type cytochrome oxidase subunit 3